jgi:hypothetical protein
MILKRQFARLMTTCAASGSKRKLNSALIVTLPSASEFPPITNRESKRDPNVGSLIMQLAILVSGPIATTLISPKVIGYLLFLCPRKVGMFYHQVAEKVDSRNNDIIYLDIHLSISILLDVPFHFF